MLQYNRIDISEEIDVNKKNLSKECDICHYWYSKDIGFKCEPYLCNGCDDLMQKAMSFNNVSIAYVKGNAYQINFWYMSKDDAINIMVLIWLIKGVFYENFLLYMKMSESAYLTYSQRNRDVIRNRAKDYYENCKERFRRQARDKYRNVSEEEKNKKREYGIKKITKYQQNYREAKKSQNNNE